MATQPVTLLPSSDFVSDNPASVTIARNIGGLTFDAVISESHVSELQVTENPVETGVSIADHCFMRPLRVTISAVVSDLKMPSAPNLYDGSPSGRVRKAFEYLQYLQTDLANNTGAPFEVITGLRTYDDMVCTSLTATQDVTTASLLAFTAELTQIKTVSTAAVAYVQPKPMQGKPVRQATPAVNQGPQQPQEETVAQKRSAAARLFGIKVK